jgi:hypothetical protein
MEDTVTFHWGEREVEFRFVTRKGAWFMAETREKVSLYRSISSGWNAQYGRHQVDGAAPQDAVSNLHAWMEKETERMQIIVDCSWKVAALQSRKEGLTEEVRTLSLARDKLWQQLNSPLGLQEQLERYAMEIDATMRSVRALSDHIEDWKGSRE